MAKSSGVVVTGIVGAVFLSIGAGVGVYHGKPIYDTAKASKNWPTTSGKIVESVLEKRRKSKTKRTTYTAVVAFRYSIDGVDYESDRVWFGSGYSTSSRSSMQKIVSDYPVGKEVTVYYSPNEPAEACLLPGAHFSSGALYLFGLIFTGVGGLVLAGVVFKIVMLGTALATTRSTDDQSDFGTFDGPTHRDRAR